jgi:hypothetical protein
MDHDWCRCVIADVLARLRVAVASCRTPPADFVDSPCSAPTPSQRKVAPVSSEVVSYQLDDKTTALFEIEAVAGFRPAGVGDIAGRVKEAAAPAIEAARELLEQVRDLAPDGVEVKFGIKVTGTTNWLIAKAATEGNFEVTLSWQPGTGPANGPSSEG